MITKAKEHDTDRAGRRIFTETMESINFLVNPVTEDYGTDYNVQAFDGKNPTGAWFQVQLKSSEFPSYAADGSFISYPLDLDHLVHYATEVSAPIFVVNVDTTARRVFWFSPQLSAATILEAEKSNQQTLTLRIPTEQELPRSAGQLVEALRKIYILLSSRTLISATAASFQEAISSIPHQEEMFASFQEKIDVVRMSRIAADHAAGRSEDALRRAEVLSIDGDASLEVRYHALTQMNSIEWSRDLHSGIVGPALADSTFHFAKRLQTLAVGSPKWVRLTAIFVSAIAKLEVSIHQDGTDYMTLKHQIEVDASPLVILGILVRRTALAKQILAQYVRCYRLARLAAANQNRWAFRRILTRLPTTIAPYLVALRFDKMQDTESVFLKSSLEVLEWSADISFQIRDLDSVVLAVMGAVSLGNDENSAAYVWAEAVAERIPSGKHRDDAKAALARTSGRWRGEQQPGDYNPNPIWQIIQKIAHSMNVDISDEDSVFVRRLRIAARDDNPGEILQFCENLIVTFGSISRIDRAIRSLLGIDTSSNKVVHCRLFNFHVEATEAGSAFSIFREKYCAACTSRSPRRDDWRYSGDVRKQLDGENRAVVKQWFADGKGMRFVDKDDLE